MYFFPNASHCRVFQIIVLAYNLFLVFSFFSVFLFFTCSPSTIRSRAGPLQLNSNGHAKTSHDPTKYTSFCVASSPFFATWFLSGFPFFFDLPVVLSRRPMRQDELMNPSAVVRVVVIVVLCCEFNDTSNALDGISCEAYASYYNWQSMSGCDSERFF